MPVIVLAPPELGQVQWREVCAGCAWSVGLLPQAVHSGADLQSAAGAVLGYRQAAVKGRTLAVDPAPGAASPALKALLQDCLLAQSHQVPALDNSVATLHWWPLSEIANGPEPPATGLLGCCVSPL